MMEPFSTEAELTNAVLRSQTFRQYFFGEGREAWEAREVEGLFGIPDVVICMVGDNRLSRGHVVSFAFEMKRSDWNKALTQAFKYMSFADYSYVVMDAFYVHRALRRIERFERANIGLISVTREGVVTRHYRPNAYPPYSPPLKVALENRVIGDAVSFGEESTDATKS